MKFLPKFGQTHRTEWQAQMRNNDRADGGRLRSFVKSTMDMKTYDDPLENTLTEQLRHYVPVDMFRGGGMMVGSTSSIITMANPPTLTSSGPILTNAGSQIPANNFDFDPVRYDTGYSRSASYYARDASMISPYHHPVFTPPPPPPPPKPKPKVDPLDRTPGSYR